MRDPERAAAPRPALRGSWCSAAAIGIAVVGSLLLAFTTARGPGVAPDSVDYVMAARELLAGHGLVVQAGSDGFRPLTHYPPLFPLALAAIGSLGPDPLVAARWLDVLLFGVNILLVATLLRRLEPGSCWLPVLGAALVAVAPPLRLHAFVLSEPLFLALGFTGMLLLARWLESGGGWRMACAGAAVGLASLCRWAGVAFAAAGLAGILLIGGRTLRERSTGATAFAALSLLPGAAWLLRNRWIAGTAAERPLAFHPPGAVHWEQLAQTLGLWFLTYRTAGVVLIVAGAGVGIAAALRAASRGRTPTPPAPLASLLLLFCACYAGMLLASITFVDHHTPLNGRILSPFFVATVVLVVHLGHRLVSAADWEPLGWAAVAVATGFLVGQAADAGRWLVHTANEGQPFFGPDAWPERSEVIARVMELPEGVRLYSNGADALYLLTGRRASDLPRKANPASRERNERYALEMREVVEQMREHRAVIVWLGRLDWRWYFPSRRDLLLHHPVRPAVRASDGVIFVARP